MLDHTLHIVSSSPFETNALSSCLRFVRSQDGIILIENAVLVSVEKGAWWSVLQRACIEQSLDLYALQADCEARGLLDCVGAFVELVNDQQFVQKVVAYGKTQSWF